MEVILTNKAQKDLEKLDHLIKKRIIQKIENFETGKSVDISGLGKNLFKIRIGDYRIIIKKQEEKYYVLRVGHRKNIYKEF